MTDETDIRVGADVRGRFNLMIGDSLPQALNTHAAFWQSVGSALLGSKFRFGKTIGLHVPVSHLVQGYCDVIELCTVIGRIFFKVKRFGAR